MLHVNSDLGVSGYCSSSPSMPGAIVLPAAILRHWTSNAEDEEELIGLLVIT